MQSSSRQLQNSVGLVPEPLRFRHPRWDAPLTAQNTDKKRTEEQKKSQQTLDRPRCDEHRQHHSWGFPMSLLTLNGAFTKAMAERVASAALDIAFPKTAAPPQLNKKMS